MISVRRATRGWSSAVEGGGIVTWTWELLLDDASGGGEVGFVGGPGDMTVVLVRGCMVGGGG